MSETQTSAAPTEGEQGQEQSFTQADVDRIVRERVGRERAKFADYDDLKAKAEGAKTAEQRIADLEKRLAEADSREQHRQLVAKVAKENGITDPDDISLFLTGSDEDTLTAQAKRIAAKASVRPSGNYVPNEGRTSTPPGGDADMRQFARQLFEQE